MQRTRITAKLLVGLAVTAVSGCVSVEPQAGPPQHPGTAGPVQDVTPQIVQPPAREALEIMDPSPSAARPDSPAPSAAPGPSPAARGAGPSPAPRREARGDPRQRRTPPRVPGVPPLTTPAVPRVPGGGADVCALGRGYGGWPAGSRESRICEETYGR